MWISDSESSTSPVHNIVPTLVKQLSKSFIEGDMLKKPYCYIRVINTLEPMRLIYGIPWKFSC
jgi:hypothetical protein